MSTYFNTVTKEYPRHQGDLELLGWAVGQSLPENWVKVEPIDRPEFTETQKVVEGEPVEIDGVWTQVFEVLELTAEELAWRQAPTTAKAKLIALGLTEAEVAALQRGLVR